MDKQKVLKVVLSVTLYIALLGSLNWGLQALNMNAVELLVGKDNTMALNVVYYTVACICSRRKMIRINKIEI